MAFPWQASLCQEFLPLQSLTSFLSPYFLRRWQIYVQIARHGIRDGPPTTLGYSFGMWSRLCLWMSNTQLNPRSVNCASVHRKIGTHVSKVYVTAAAGEAYMLTQARNFQEEPDNGCLDKGAG
jgi:hypothetical protein